MKNFNVIEELARVEQKIAMRDGRRVSLEEMPSVKNLSAEEKTKFNKYIKKREGRRKIIYGSAFLTLILAFFIGTGITGQVIRGSEGNLSSAEIFGSMFLIVIFIALVFMIVREKRAKARFKKHLDIIEKYT